MIQVLFFAVLAWFYLLGTAGLAGHETDRDRDVDVADREIGDLPRNTVGGGLPDPSPWRKGQGPGWYEKTFLPRIGPWALYGLLFTIVILFASKAQADHPRPLDVVRIALPCWALFRNQRDGRLPGRLGGQSLATRAR